MSAKSMDDIALLMKQMRFKKCMFGGVREMDVWRKLDQLHQQYQCVFTVQQALYERQLEQKEQRIAQLEEELTRLQSGEER